MRRLAVILVALGALAAPALAHAAAPPIARPNPVTYPIRLDYESPLPGPDGKPAILAPLGEGVIIAATNDEAYLAYEKQDDLGGFMPAPIGRLTLTTGGHDVLSPGTHKPQIPLFESSAGGKVKSFTFTGAPPSGPTPPPDNGSGGPQPPPPPTPGNTVPPANQGFGGQPGNGKTGGGGSSTTTTGGGSTTTTRRPPPPTTTTTTTTSSTAAETTTTTTTTTPGGGGSGGCSGGPCAAGSCGTAGIEIDSNPAGCVISIANAVPGDSVSEVMTITNTTGAAYTLEFEATGPNNNHLWQDLEMDVFDPLVGPASPMPPLSSWLGSFHTLTTLNSGQTVQYEIELYLPTTAGNQDQGKSAVIAFTWHAQG